MSSIIYLIGGGELRNGDTQLIDEDIMSQAPQGSTFAFFGFASNDNADYANTIKSVYGDKYTVVVPTVAKGRKYAIDAIKSAAVIYLGGGNTQQLMKIFDQWGLVEYLHAAIDRGTHVAGMSAGAQALVKWYVHEDNDIFELRKGWDFVPLGVLVHANPTSYKKAALLWFDHDISDTYSFIAIGESAAWRISGFEKSKVGLGNIWTMPS